jgi:crotonobetainyl-CoA:carnitine CoA-transferase CaiB-like acyl-CoA transferase
VRAFASIDACFEPVLAPDEVPRHPAFADSFVTVGSAKLPRTPFVRATHSIAPTQGQHTAEILREAGFSADEISQLSG